MKRIKLITSLIILFILTNVHKAQAQNYLGVINSNYSGIMGADLQPASIVDNNFVVDVNLFSFSFDAYQNAKYFDASILPKRSWFYSLKKDTAWMKKDNLYEDSFHDVEDYNNSSAKPRGAYINMQLDLLNFMFHINRKIAVGFSAKVRFIGNFDQINPRLMKLTEEVLDYAPLWHQQIDGSLLSQSSMAWAEYGVNYAQVVYDKEDHFIKVGGRLKFNQGIAATYVHAKDLEFDLLNKDTATTFRGNFNYGYSGNVDKFFDGTSEFKSVGDVYNIVSKLGIGVDLGVVYEWRPDWAEYKYDMDGETNLWRRDKNKYKIKVGASLLDLGGMRFTKADKSRNFSVNTTQLDLTIFNKASSPNDFSLIIDSLIKNDPDWTADQDTSETFYVHTPTALSLQFSWNIWNDFNLDAAAYINVNSKDRSNVRMPSQFSVTPTYDYKWAGVGVPVSFNPYSGFRVGLGLRLGPLTVGVPDLKTLFPGGKIRGAGIYAGLRIPVLYAHPRDRDNDLVSDKKDLCPDIPGVWDFKGCPDTDGDGIQDSEDECPNEPGLAEFNGCPDTDGDGIPDKDDDCPEEAGLPEFNGCPDTDGDGIPDKDDDCPNEAGLAEFNGCPDTDGDGIPDYRDACPDVAGPAEYDGCPDTDGDGVLDFLDECPTIPGPKENNGCPWPDSDGDGILDKDDDCPHLAGPKENKGCPYTDTDGDGVPDKDDDCPETPGPASNRGCPEIEAEVQEALQTAFDNLEFETARAVIRASSYESLNKLAEVLNEKPEWGLQLSGYTDNVGNPQSNMVLSKKRAEAVRDYLAGQGVSAARMYVLYFGDRDPVAPNDTPEGRQMNRRVEMSLIFK